MWKWPGLLLPPIDQMWIDHLETMDYMRQVSVCAATASVIPRNTVEAYRLYHELLDLIRQTGSSTNVPRYSKMALGFNTLSGSEQLKNLKLKDG